MGEGDLAALYRQLRSPLLWHLRCLGATEAEAADAVQDAFAHALRAAAQVRDDSAWPAWLRTVAIRCFLRSVARRGGRGSGAVSVLAMADVPDLEGTADVAGEAQLRLQEEAVLSMLAALPPQQRRVFALHYEGCSTAEIAAALCMDQAAVRQNLARARAALKRSMPHETVTREDW
ncbi:MAG TPA: RNA polymerase sigma factor [Streptosporangiaceae bacterium]|nr:RNA polymerase sigma factor [Streptosporangiaceae bacterium]